MTRSQSALCLFALTAALLAPQVVRGQDEAAPSQPPAQQPIKVGKPLKNKGVEAPLPTAPQETPEVKVAEAPAAPPAPADAEQKIGAEVVIRTTTGQEFTGKLTEQTGEQVSLMTKSGPVTIPRNIIQEMRYRDVDYRPASERIEAADIPAGKGPEHLEKAKEAFRGGNFEQTVSLCKGLMAMKTTEFSPDQRQAVGKVAAGAYFELKDWKAAADGLKYSSFAIENQTDRARLQAMAEALTENTPPVIGGQTAASFEQAQQLSMKWKADRIFAEVKQYVEGVKETHRREIVELTADCARTNLGKSEVYVPGYSVQRWPEIAKALVGQMLDTVEKATVECDERVKDIMRFRKYKIASVKVAAEVNEKIYPYLKIRQAAEDCLGNVQFVETKYQLKELYEKERFDKLAKKVDEQQYYPKQQGFPDGMKIAPTKFGT